MAELSELSEAERHACPKQNHHGRKTVPSIPIPNYNNLSSESIVKCKLNRNLCKQTSARQSIKQVIATMSFNKTKIACEKEQTFTLKDDYEKAYSCGELVKKPTGIIFDEKMLLHKCEWGPTHIENPNRYRAILDRFMELNLISRCQRLYYELIDISDITKLHTLDLYKKLEYVSTQLNLEEMERESTNYDSVYFNKETYTAAMISASCAVKLVKEVCLGTIQNGIAILRPPGHHAMTNEYSGFCILNNVAIAAQYALDNNLATKILILDYDVHHGQATQQMFYDSNKVLYFSIHRYEYGEFWPNLRESDYDYIGDGNGKGFNINFPLNKIGLTDADYVAITTHILLPLAYEYQPDLIIVSAGYDACIGCYEGEMNVTPGFYGHLITLMSGLAQSKLAVCLEGGYFAPSLAEGVAMTLKALLGDPNATLPPQPLPHETTIITINNLKLMLRTYWKCFQALSVYDSEADTNIHEAIVLYLGTPPVCPFLTRFNYPEQGTFDIVKNTEIVRILKIEYEKLLINLPVSVCYDKSMLLHISENVRHFESPDRLNATYIQYQSWGLEKRCLNLKPKLMPISILQNIHCETYLNQILENQFEKLVNSSQDLFYDKNSKSAIMSAADSLLTVVDSVMESESSAGVALIRPPGHHAEKAKAAGFCYLNNIAIAAQYTLNTYHLNRILIVDFDIHHGNGTQSIFYENKNVLYISIHKYDNGEYFPYSSGADYDQCGTGDGRGFNVNVPLNGGSLYNIDYISMFHRIILPIAYSYAPEVVLVSAGFDAGINDPLGNYQLTPDCFGHFIQMLKPLANGKLILALEGGYNVTTVKFAMNICIKALLGDPLPSLDLIPNSVTSNTIDTINLVIAAQKPHWLTLGIDKNLSSLPPKVLINETHLINEMKQKMLV